MDTPIGEVLIRLGLLLLGAVTTLSYLVTGYVAWAFLSAAL
jgi:hypothetical protein